LSVSEDAFIEVDRVEKVFDVRKKTGFLKRERRQVRAVDSISFTVAMIPETRRRTTLGRAAAGSSFNLEADIFARYGRRGAMTRVRAAGRAAGDGIRR